MLLSRGVKYRVFLERCSKDLGGGQGGWALFLFTSDSLGIGQKLNTHEKEVF